MRRRIRWLVPVVLAAAVLLGLSLLARRHPIGGYGTETDFYYFYAPHAERLAAGAFPVHTSQGPGYPLAIALVSRITGDSFVAGKVVSVVSGTLAVLLTFAIGARLFGYWTGAGAAVLVALSPQFAKYAISATTDVFALALMLGALLAALHGRVPLAAFIAGYAYLTRYNSVAVAVGIAVVLLWYERRRALWFIGVFAITIAPWIVVNGTRSPQYVNVVLMMYPELAHGLDGIDAARELTGRFGSLGEVVAYDPPRAIRRYAGNVLGSLRTSGPALIGTGGALLALCGVILGLRSRLSISLALFVATAAAHFLLAALARWETRYYFFVLVTYAILAVYAAGELLALARRRGLLRDRGFTAVPVAVVLTLCVVNAAWSRAEILRFLDLQPLEIFDACRVLGAQRVRILARKPHLAFTCRQEWVFLPDVRSVNELPPADYLAVAVPEVMFRRPLVASLRTRPAWVSGNGRLALYRLRP